MKDLNDKYPNLFKKSSEETIQSGEESSEEGRAAEDDGADTANDYESRWGWWIWVSEVSKEWRVSWFETLEQTAIMFLNTVCFIIDKNNNEKKQIENWKRKN